MVDVRCGLNIPSREQVFSITRLAEWCRTVIPSDELFNSHRTTIIESFSCILLLRPLYLSLDMRYFYQFEAEISTFLIKKCSVRLLSTTLWRHCTRSSYSPWYKTEISRTGESRGKPCRVCKNIMIIHVCEMRIETSVRESQFVIARLCRGMPNSDPRNRCCYPHQTAMILSFSCIPLDIQRLMLA